MKMIQKFNDFPLQKKLTFSFILVVLVPIMLVGVFLTQELHQNAVLSAKEITQDNMERVKKRVLEVVKVPTYISNNLQFDERLSELTNHQYNSLFEVVDAYQSYDDFYYYQQMYPAVHRIYFMMDNPTMLNNWSFIPIDQNPASWYQEGMDANGNVLWKYIESPTERDEHFLSLIRKINFLEYKTNGLLIITITPEQIDWILSQETTPTFLVDDEQNIISSNQSEYIGSKMTDFIQEDIMEQTMPFILEGNVQGEPSQIAAELLPIEASENGLQLITVTPKKDIVQDANRLSLLGITTTFIGVIMAFILIRVVSWAISKRLSRLSTKLEQVGEGDLQSKLPIDGKDEIGQLAIRFNDMVDNISQLLDEVQESNRQKRAIERQQEEIRFKMLASQINPHFLFNTLESIRMKLHLQGEKDVAEVVKLLGKLMRKNLQMEGRKIQIQDEIDTVRSYLEIQAFRFGDRLSYSIHVDEGLKEALILPLIVQPLVENAVIHGLEGKESDGTVNISVKEEEEQVTIRIIDNGVGIAPDRLHTLYEMLEQQKEKDGYRIGLRNVYQRLVMMYGEESKLVISSEVGKGTHIYFTIPKEA